MYSVHFGGSSCDIFTLFTIYVKKLFSFVSLKVFVTRLYLFACIMWVYASVPVLTGVMVTFYVLLKFLIALYEDVVIKHRKNEVLTHFILYKILRTVCLNQTISSELFGSEISLLIVTLVIPTHNKYFYEDWVFCYSFNFKTTCYSIAPFITNDNLNLNTVGGLNVTFSKFSPFIHGAN